MKRLLLVEDDPHTRTMVEWVLERYGYQVDSLNSGAAALELLRLKRFDGIILDIMLIDLDGLEVLRQIKIDALPAPVIVMTGYEYLAQSAVRDGGADDYLVKPFANRDLRSLIERWVGPSGALVGA